MIAKKEINRRPRPRACHADMNAACDEFWRKRGEKPLTWGESRSRDIEIAKIRKRIRDLEAGEERKNPVEAAAAELERASSE